VLRINLKQKKVSELLSVPDTAILAVIVVAPRLIHSV